MASKVALNATVDRGESSLLTAEAGSDLPGTLFCLLASNFEVRLKCLILEVVQRAFTGSSMRPNVRAKPRVSARAETAHDPGTGLM